MGLRMRIRRTMFTAVLFFALAVPVAANMQRDASPTAINTCSFSAPAPNSEGTPQLLACGGIPGRLLTSSGGVKLSAFPIKTSKGYREDRGQAWSIDKDTAQHGGRAWKLKDPRGKRVASLYSNGKVATID